jgi:hypothetical protein
MSVSFLNLSAVMQYRHTSPQPAVELPARISIGVTDSRYFSKHNNPVSTTTYVAAPPVPHADAELHSLPSIPTQDERGPLTLGTKGLKQGLTDVGEVDFGVDWVSVPSFSAPEYAESGS